MQDCFQAPRSCSPLFALKDKTTRAGVRVILEEKNPSQFGLIDLFFFLCFFTYINYDNNYKIKQNQILAKNSTVPTRVTTTIPKSFNSVPSSLWLWVLLSPYRCHRVAAAAACLRSYAVPPPSSCAASSKTDTICSLEGLVV